MPQFHPVQLCHRGDYAFRNQRPLGSPTAASQHVDNLVRTGLIARTEDRDRRAKQIQLSERGRALIQRGFSARYRWADALASAIEPKDQDRVAEAVAILAEAARKLEQAS
jgi:DNA-binding MarR family transcriptional regulator